jgi:hypothetical protein
LLAMHTRSGVISKREKISSSAFFNSAMRMKLENNCGTKKAEWIG